MTITVSGIFREAPRPGRIRHIDLLPIAGTIPLVPHSSNHAVAIRQLKKDPAMRKIIDRVGPCTLRPRSDHFISLCEAIFSQQLNVKVADVLFGRFCDFFPRRKPTPPLTVRLLETATQEKTRRAGLSRQKRSYVLDLARHFDDGRIKPRSLPRMSDDEVIQTLTQVKGIGRWTAEMHLIFVLNRPDIWPVDDLGLQESVRIHYGLEQRPKPKQLEPFGDRFRPFRSIATWYLWRGK